MQSQTIELHIKPDGIVLTDYYNDRSRVSFIRGPLGSGKTIQSCLKILQLMCEQEPNDQGIRPSRWYAIRNTYSDLLTTTCKDWLSVTDGLGKFSKGGKEPPHHNLEFRLEDGTKVKSEMIFLSMDREDHVKKLRGSQVTGFWLNETKELLKSTIDMADGRHGRYPSIADGGVRASWRGMIGDTNSPDDDSWYYDLAENVKPEGWSFHVQPGGVIWDEQSKQYIANPKAENLKNLIGGSEYYTKQMQGKNLDWIKCNLANEYSSVFDGRPIYTCFNESIHKKEFELDPSLPLLFGWDFGRTPSCVIGQLTSNGRFLIRHEFYTEGMGIKTFGLQVIRPFLVRRYKGWSIGLSCGDPAGASAGQADDISCIQMLSNPYNSQDPELGGVGIPTIPSPDLSNSFQARTQAVEGNCNRLIDGEPAILIHPDCKLLIKGFNGGYEYKRVQSANGSKFTDKPNKNKFSHPHEALQYLSIAVNEGLVYEQDDYEDDFHEENRNPVTGY